VKLTIVTPLSVAVEEDGVLSITAEDETGSFGVLPGHADFVTALTISVVSWKRRGNFWRHCAICGGSLSVERGSDVVVTSREAVPGDDLDNLEKMVLARFLSEADAEKSEHVDSTRMQLAAIRQLVRHLHATGKGGAWS
jgi:F-type H+-transporting ATPase subunit epsilon